MQALILSSIKVDLFSVLAYACYAGLVLKYRARSNNLSNGQNEICPEINKKNLLKSTERKITTDYKK